MNKQFRLWLLLSLGALATDRMPLAYGQNSTELKTIGPTTNKQSHYPLPGELDLTNAQEMMAQRFQELHQLHQLHQLQDQVQGLLKDPQFLKRLNSEPGLQRLQEKLRNGEMLRADPALREWLHQAAKQQKLDQRQIEEMLHRLAESANHKPPPIESGETMLGGTAAGVPAPSSPLPPGLPLPPPSLPPPEPSPSLIDRLQEKTTKWLMENIDNESGEMLQALTEMDVRPQGELGKERFLSLAKLLRSVPQADFSGINVNEHPLVPTLRRERLSRYLSNLGSFVHGQSGRWNRVSSFFREASLPSLPRFGRHSVSPRASSTADDARWVPALLALLMLGTIVLLLYKRGFGSKSPVGAGKGGQWCLGPWPVPPGAVSRRQDVIRAFEYLVLLCLGPAAAACHHHQLAERLAEPPQSPSGTGGGIRSAGRRQAAEMLAWLYEQARYAPADEALSQEQLSDARQALCFLAGVNAS